MIYVLDASALLRFLDEEPGVDRIDDIFVAHAADQARVVMSAVHYGEVIGISYRRGGQAEANAITIRLKELGIEIVDATAIRASKSGIIHRRDRIPYVDSFAIELTLDSPDHILITADFDFKPAATDIAIEFLPTKP